MEEYTFMYVERVTFIDTIVASSEKEARQIFIEDLHFLAPAELEIEEFTKL